jgi:DNA-directed RNA polymerase subunit RPC12/RpoP
VNEVDLIARDDPHLICNNCKTEFHPYPDSHAPAIDEVVCPKCGAKRLLYFGDDPTVVKMILSNIGINKEINENLTDLQNQITIMKENMGKSLVDAKNTMTTALVKALNHEIEEHELKWHPTSHKS